MMPMPIPAEAGRDFIGRQCKKRGWRSYEKRWRKAVDEYRNNRGDPWSMQIAPFGDFQQKKLKGLYDTRRSKGAIGRLRKTERPSQCCPMCGSLGGPSLDHALPRSIFPEFSILLENLVPACSICNTDEKKSTYKGCREGERFLHPYYDDWIKYPVWEVELHGDMEAPLFIPRPLLYLDGKKRRAVDFHLKEVLGSEWSRFCRSRWGALPGKLALHQGRGYVSGDLTEYLQTMLLSSNLEFGVNSWQSAFDRGVANSSRATFYLKKMLA